jgi:hypothetical protein
LHGFVDFGLSIERHGAKFCRRVRMVRVKAMAPAKAAQEYLAWCDEARERYEERVAILSDGGLVTPERDWVARFEARRVHVRTVAERACAGSVSFGMGAM